MSKETELLREAHAELSSLADGDPSATFVNDTRELITRIEALLNSEKDHEENILEEANRIVRIDEGRTLRYGHPAVNFTHTANMWRAAFAWDVNAQKVAMAIILLKLSREVNMHTRDNLTDIAGYARTVEMVEDYFEEIRKKISESGDNPDEGTHANPNPAWYIHGMCRSRFDVDGDTVHCTALETHEGHHRGTHASGTGVQWRDEDGYYEPLPRVQTGVIREDLPDSTHS